MKTTDRSKVRPWYSGSRLRAPEALSWERRRRSAPAPMLRDRRRRAVSFPTTKLGRFDIHVTATYQNRTGEATISQTNSPNDLSLQGPVVKKRPLWRNKYVWIGAGAAVVIAVVLVVTLGHSSSTQTVTIAPGPVTINQ